MPFIANHDGERVIPEGVPNGTPVTCVDCGERMYPRSKSSDGRARHFYHPKGSSDCEVVATGESDIHRKLKSLAVSRLKSIFEGGLAKVGPEVQLQAPSDSPVDERYADALARFKTRDPQLGRGIIAEVQYQNKGKNIKQTTRDYLRNKYSVVWLTPSDFAEKACLLDEAQFRERAKESVWPHQVPPTEAWTPSHDYLDSQQAPEVLLEIQFGEILPRQCLKDWWAEGHRKCPAARDTLPEPGEWSGIHEFSVSQQSVSRTVSFPPELLEQERPNLKRIHAMHKHGEFDFIRELRSANATRRCSVCGHTADAYIRGASELKGFYCQGCLPGS